MATRMICSLAAGLVLVAGMATTTAFAHEHDQDHGGMMKGMMNDMDTNHDGMVSAAEHAVHAKMMFDKMDSNHDGMLSKDEMEAGMKAMHEEREVREEHHEHMMKKEGDAMDDKKEAMDEKTEK
jgi:hypothetical protein